MMKYRLAVCGGTFDHFHKGHEAFLRAALSMTHKLMLGITSDTYTERFKHSPTIQLYKERKKSVEGFLAREHALERVSIAQIDDVFYPHQWETLPLEAVIVTDETKKGAEMINARRLENGLSALRIVTIPLLPDEIGEKISSTNVRQGVINTEGIHYVHPEWFSKDLALPDIQRQWFKRPFGTLETDSAIINTFDMNKLVTVGDVVTSDCNSHHIRQKLSVVDFTIQRKKTYDQIQELGFSGEEIVLTAKNPSGHITSSLFNAITKSIELLSQKKQIVIAVHGEEDLAVIPLVLALPLDFVIIYGQPNEGFVILNVTTEVKDKAYELLQKFISIGY